MAGSQSQAPSIIVDHDCKVRDEIDLEYLGEVTAPTPAWSSLRLKHDFLWKSKKKIKRITLVKVQKSVDTLADIAGNIVKEEHDYRLGEHGEEVDSIPDHTSYNKVSQKKYDFLEDFVTNSSEEQTNQETGKNIEEHKIQTVKPRLNQIRKPMTGLNCSEL